MNASNRHGKRVEGWIPDPQTLQTDMFYYMMISIIGSWKSFPYFMQQI